jgi:predicted RNA-binding Zn ribbon-like protein
MNPFMRFISCVRPADPCISCDFSATSTFGATIMTTLLDIKSSLAKLSSDIAAEKAEVSAAVLVLTEQVAALQATLAAGTGVTAEDLDALMTQINGVDAAVKDIMVTPAVEAPAVAVVEAPAVAVVEEVPAEE